MNIKKLLFVGVLMALLVAACGGGGGSSGDDPVATVKDFAKAMEKLDIEAAQKLVCEQYKSEYDITSAFAEMEAAGMDPDELLGAFKVNMKDMKYEKKSQEGDNAVVHMSGKISLGFDEGKLKSVLKKAMEAAGQSLSDEELDMAMGFFTSMAGQEQDFDGDVKLVKEDGKWVICDEMNLMDEIDLGF